MAAVVEVLHRAVVAGHGQVVEAQVGEGHLLDVRRGVGGDAVARERKITGRQDAALRVLDVEVVDARQVAHVARQHDVALVLDRARLRAVAHAQIALAGVGAERHEQDHRALVDEVPAEFGELAVVADHDPDRPAVGHDRLRAVAAADAPPGALVGRGVQLVAGVQRAVAQRDVADVAHLAIVVVTGARGMRAADDVDVVAHRKFAQQLREALGVAGQREQRIDRRQRLVLHRQQLQGEELGEHHEIGAIVGRDVDEVLDLRGELLERGDAPLLVLHGRHTHRFGQRARGRPRIGARVDLRVAPHQVRGIAARLGVAGQVTRQHADEFETVAELETQRAVTQAPGADGLDIGVDVVAERLRAPAVARQPSTEDDALQAEVLAQPLAQFVQASADAQAAMRRIDADLHAVEPVAGRQMA